MKIFVPITKSIDRDTPTPTDPLANIDSNLVSGGKDKTVSAAEVRGATERASLTPSPHRNTKHLGPHEWVHVAPDGGSTGRGSRVTGEDVPLPDKHVDDGYRMPESNPSVHGGNGESAETKTANPDSEEENAYALAMKGYDFTHPHIARSVTEGFLRHLTDMGREKEAQTMRTVMHEDDRLSLYPWEIAKATDGHQWILGNIPYFEGEPSPNAESDLDKGYKTKIFGLPRRPKEVDPVELKIRIARRKENAKKKRKFKFHPHPLRKDDEEEILGSYVADDTRNNDDEQPDVEFDEPEDDESIENEEHPEGEYVAKSLKLMVKSGTSKVKSQDISPTHVYKQRDGRGYRNINVVPVGVPHGANARQEFPDPSWRLDANGHISFSSRDHKRHPRHPHTILPVDPSEHGRQNLNTLHQMSRHARATADRDGDTNGFWDRLPTAEEIPFYPNDKGENDIESYESIRHIQRGAEDSARKDKIHSHAAESWRDYAKTVANAIEQHTGKHPEMHLLMRDLERMGALMEKAEKSQKKDLEEEARMRTFPLPGVNFRMHCDRSLVPPKNYAILDQADSLMMQFAERIGKCFSEHSVHDSREENVVKTQRRAWLQLSKDLKDAQNARHPNTQEVTPVLHTWSDSPKDGSGSPFFLLSQFHLTQNFHRLIPERKQQMGQRHLSMTFQKYAKDVVKDLSLSLPEEIRNVRIIDYIEKVKPTVRVSMHQLPIILAEGVLSPDTMKDVSGVSHSSIVNEERVGGMNHGVYLYDGEQFGESDVTFVLYPRIYDEDGAVGVSSQNLMVDRENHLDLKHKLYRPSRTNRALMHLFEGIEPSVAGERWADLVKYRYTLLRSQITIVPRFISLVHVKTILLNPSTPSDIVESMRKLAEKHGRSVKIVVGSYHDTLY